MLVNIEKYIIQGWIDLGSIFLLLRYDYPDQPICKRDLYKNNPGDADAFKMIQ